MSIMDKVTMYRKLRNGEFGNHLRSWDYNEWLNDPENLPERTGIRSLKEGGPFYSRLKTKAEINEALKEIDRLGYYWHECMFCEAAPDEAVTFQGHYRNDNGKRILEYSVTPGLTLREASRDFLYAENFAARFIIKDLLDASDAEWLEELLEKYPNHVIEFSNFRYPLGSLNRPMVIWEVRSY